MNDASSPTPSDLDPKDLAALIEQQWRIFANINEWIRFADTKAGAILAANGVLVGAALNLLKDNRSHVQSHLVMLAGLIIGLLVVGTSAVYCLLCIYPKTRIGDPTSLIFFDHIARKHTEYGTYAKAWLDTAAEKNTTERVYGPYKQITQQIWANSLVAERKHRQVACAIRFLVAALLCALVLGIMAAF